MSLEPSASTRTRVRGQEPRRSRWRIVRWFAEDVWSSGSARRGGIWRISRILYLATKGFFEDRCLSRASALTYITVLSLVPLLAFAFSMAKGFGIYQSLLDDTINPFLDRTFGTMQPQDAVHLPSEGSHEIRSAIAQVLGFVEKTDVGALGLFGLVLLLYTVIKLLATIERSFNDIWGVQRSRSLIRKVADYMAMVIVTPLLLFIAAGVTTAAQNSGVVDFLRGRLGMDAPIDFLTKLTPLIALWLGFTFVYMAMPNARTRLVSALIGAIVAGTLWQIALVLHLRFQVGIARYNAIYSSFAAVPIFLMWVNVSWVIVLLGAEICFAHQGEPSYVHVAHSRPRDHAFKEQVGLRVMTRVGEGFLCAAPPRTALVLAAELDVPQRELEEVIYVLVDRGLLAETNEAHERAFLPARDLDSITVKAVLDALKGTAGPVDVPSPDHVDEQIDRILGGIDVELAESRWNRSIKSLAETALRERSAAACAELQGNVQGEGEPARV
jgi:membrane protein